MHNIQKILLTINIFLLVPLAVLAQKNKSQTLCETSFLNQRPIANYTNENEKIALIFVMWGFDKTKINELFKLEKKFQNNFNPAKDTKASAEDINEILAFIDKFLTTLKKIKKIEELKNVDRKMFCYFESHLEYFSKIKTALNTSNDNLKNVLHGLLINNNDKTKYAEIREDLIALDNKYTLSAIKK